MDTILKNPALRLYNVLSLRLKFEQGAAEEVVNAVEELINGTVIQETKSLATREDILQLENRLQENISSKINQQTKWFVSLGVTAFIFVVGLVLGLYFKK
jgi:hypothetical protein